MEFRDYYEVLGIHRDATQDDIRKAYRTLARKYHPDVSDESDAEEKFKEVGEAYEVLKDPEKRTAYNQLGENWKTGQDFQPPPGWDAGFEFSGADFSQADQAGFSDFFENLFGGHFHGGERAGRPGFRGRGEDHHAKILVDVEDSYAGATRSISLRVPELTEDGRKIRKPIIDLSVIEPLAGAGRDEILAVIQKFSAEGASFLRIEGDVIDISHEALIARFETWAAAGVEPRIMGIGPVPATRRVLDLAAPGAGQITPEQRFQHEHEGVAAVSPQSLPKHVGCHRPHLREGNAHFFGPCLWSGNDRFSACQSGFRVGKRDFRMNNRLTV